MIGIACILSGYAMYWGVKLFPVLPPMVHMLDQPKLNPQKESDFFRDGFGMRLPVPGTVARNYLPYPFKTQEEAAVLANPLPETEEIFKLGKKVFTNHCAVCHGPLGDGEHRLGKNYGAKPANLHTEQIRNYPDGMIYHVIVAGKNAMPSYAADLSEDECWAAVHYVRVLQRALNARDEDLEGVKTARTAKSGSPEAPGKAGKSEKPGKSERNGGAK
jgi:mono/diheme cytochrome c family protein